MIEVSQVFTFTETVSLMGLTVCCAGVNFTMIFNLLGSIHYGIIEIHCTIHQTLVRPSLRTTLNNLGCALLVANLLFGCSFFILSLANVLQALSSNFICFSVVVIPNIYRWEHT